MLKSLYTKLALALLGLFVIIAAISVANAWFATEGYQQEVAQKLNRDLAAHIVAEKLLLKNQRINKPALNEVFHMMMVINPTIELYLLDTDGDILGYSAPPGRVQRTRIDLNPLQQFIHGETAQVLLGDDPRGIDRQKIFSWLRSPRLNSCVESVAQEQAARRLRVSSVRTIVLSLKQGVQTDLVDAAQAG